MRHSVENKKQLCLCLAIWNLCCHIPREMYYLRYVYT